MAENTRQAWAEPHSARNANWWWRRN